MNNREEPLFDEQIAFTDFGQSLYSAVPLQQQKLPLTSEPAEVRKAIREQCPAMPGVYGMLDCEQALIYVGMSVQLRDRTQTYFSTGEEQRKERRIGSRARTLLWQPTGHELTARLRELELIRRFSPRYNVLGKPERTPTGYVTLATGDAPHFRVQKRPARNCRYAWGPIPVNRRVRAAVDELNYVYRLRDCGSDVRISFREEQSLFETGNTGGCLRSELATCHAPCNGSCSRDEYTAAITAARAFLDGRDRSVLERMEADMQQAATERNYERAARLRDTVKSLSLLDELLSLFREGTRTGQFVYPVTAPNGKLQWLLISRGVVLAAEVAPHSKTSARRCLKALEAAFDRGTGAHPEDELDAVRIVLGWFRSDETRLVDILPVEDARALCRQRLEAPRSSSRLKATG
ncbi:UvrB/UvrC motif-containing protein [Maioricimonas sp. JC845]|uniref:UvrB/UvrC motif-containing protein n=1 Tax=Maioricimonas sp. JC845 TaxID=3232138 RepID=UPI0034583AD3